jgi:pimeloyl-ACP methyl ester carboxylesterase
MEEQITHITTTIGKIATYLREGSSGKLPVILLHGVYFDHQLWDNQVKEINDRTVITIDMPLHGNSQNNIKENWTLQDCADMLIEILDSLKIEKIIAVGHSWGSMTILRAAHSHPHRFAAIGLCNMPFHAASKKQRLTFQLQHTMLIFRSFYTKQAAKALFGKSSFRTNGSLISQLARPMNVLSNKEIRQIDTAVIINANDTTHLINSLKVKAIALKGNEDYVPTPPTIRTIVAEGGHVSPIEQPKKVASLIGELLD